MRRYRKTKRRARKGFRRKAFKRTKRFSRRRGSRKTSDNYLSRTYCTVLSGTLVQYGNLFKKLAIDPMEIGERYTDDASNFESFKVTRVKYIYLPPFNMNTMEASDIARPAPNDTMTIPRMFFCVDRFGSTPSGTITSEQQMLDRPGTFWWPANKRKIWSVKPVLNQSSVFSVGGGNNFMVPSGSPWIWTQSTTDGGEGVSNARPYYNLGFFGNSPVNGNVLESTTIPYNMYRYVTIRFKNRLR